MKKILCAVLALAMMLTACLAMAETVEEVIAQAQTMTNEELYAKAIEESNGKTLYGIGNSSRGKTAGASFIEMLQKLDPSYTCLLYTSPSPRDRQKSRMPSSA